MNAKQLSQCCSVSLQIRSSSHISVPLIMCVYFGSLLSVFSLKTERCDSLFWRDVLTESWTYCSERITDRISHWILDWISTFRLNLQAELQTECSTAFWTEYYVLDWIFWLNFRLCTFYRIWDWMCRPNYGPKVLTENPTWMSWLNLGLYLLFNRLVGDAGDCRRRRRLHHRQRHGALPHPVPDTTQPHPQHVHHQQWDGRHHHCGRRPGQRGECRCRVIIRPGNLVILGARPLGLQQGHFFEGTKATCQGIKAMRD